MNIGLYYPWLYLRSGGERTISEIVRRSRHNWTLITNRYESDATFPELKAARIIELSRVPVDRSMGNVARAGWTIGRQKLPLEGLDALMVVCEGLGDLVTFRNSTVPLACLCLTPLRAAFDPHYQANYLAMNGNTWKRRFALSALASTFRVVDKLAWKRYQRVFAISNEVRKRIIAGGLRQPEEVDLLYPGVDLSTLIPSDVRNPDFLIPGRIMWTKNIELGLEAFLKLLARRPDLGNYTLTIAGFVDEKSRKYIVHLRELAGGCDRVRFLESPSDHELFDLYRSCTAVLFTPFNEDWGLVPLEAMALEKPVISVNRGGPTETIIDGETGFLVEPNANTFSAAMERLADSPELSRAMGKAGRARAAQFAWSNFSERLDRGLDELSCSWEAGHASAVRV